MYLTKNKWKPAKSNYMPNIILGFLHTFHLPNTVWFLSLFCSKKMELGKINQLLFKPHSDVWSLPLRLVVISDSTQIHKLFFLLWSPSGTDLCAVLALLEMMPSSSVVSWTKDNIKRFHHLGKETTLGWWAHGYLLSIYFYNWYIVKFTLFGVELW